LIVADIADLCIAVQLTEISKYWMLTRLYLCQSLKNKKRYKYSIEKYHSCPPEVTVESFGRPTVNPQKPGK